MATIIRSLLFVGVFLCLGFPFLCAADQAEEVNEVPGTSMSLLDRKSTDYWKNPYEWGNVELTDNEIQLTANKKFFLVTKKDDGVLFRRGNPFAEVIETGDRRIIENL